MTKSQSRRNFLSATPLIGIASLSGNFLSSSIFDLEEPPGEARDAFQLFTAVKLADLIKSFQADPGEHYLYQPASLPLTIAVTTQGIKKAGEFEYHEGRDHVFLILEGRTRFEVGGLPKNARSTKLGEWLAPSSVGASTVEVMKGDMLVIPRGTPHRQSTERDVTWLLVSSSGVKKS